MISTTDIPIDGDNSELIRVSWQSVLVSQPVRQFCLRETSLKAGQPQTFRRFRFALGNFQIKSPDRV